MRSSIFAAMIAALIFSSAAAAEDLAGTYKLVSSTRKILDTGEILDTWGKNPRGFISYGNDGRMLALIVAENRTRPDTIEKITDQQRADLFRTMVAYGGTYEFDGKRVQHHIDISWNEVWTGTTVIRDLKREGNKLVYTSPAAPFSADGKMSVVTVLWEKVN
jgi:Lipocalin-like domain